MTDKLKAVSIDPFKGHAMLEIQDEDGNTKARMSVNKALRVCNAYEDVMRIAHEEGFLEAAATADKVPELFEEE